MTTAHRSIDEGFSSVTAPDEPWVDTKRRWWLLGLIVPTLPVLAWAAGTFSGISLGWWLGWSRSPCSWCDDAQRRNGKQEPPAPRVTRGAISLSSSSHLPAMEGSKPVNPVTFPPGRE